MRQIMRQAPPLKIRTTAKLGLLILATQFVWGANAQTVATTLNAEPASQLASKLSSEIGPVLGREVDSIRNIETLSEWTTLDTRRLTLRVNESQHYLLTLQDHCEHLRGARLVGVSMSNQEIWADFDHIAADGYECRIDRINRLPK